MATPQKPAVVDGSTARLYRMVILAQYLQTVESATLQRLQAVMTVKFALRRRTTTEMVHDMQNAHILSTHSKLFTLTPTGQKWLKNIEKENVL